MELKTFNGEASATSEADVRADLAAHSAPAEVEGLVRWRIDNNGAHKNPEGIWVMEQDAAERLTALQAENERLREALVKLYDDKGETIAPNWVRLIAKEALAKLKRDL